MRPSGGVGGVGRAEISSALIMRLADVAADQRECP
jgi:hypothetical protein